MAPENPHVLTCPRCEVDMKRVRAVPKFGGMPALETFVCSGCREVVTREISGELGAA